MNPDPIPGSTQVDHRHPPAAGADTFGGSAAGAPLELTAVGSGPPPAPVLGLPAVPGYEIRGEIARGGMGCVLAARDLTLGREVAIKVLLPGAPADRFVRESQVTAMLPHPGIPPVHTLGTLPDGSPYLVMKLVKGRTLADLLRERSSPADSLPRFVAVFEAICQAVGFAHAEGFIHRDLKPANVMVGSFGEVQVMDWGLAKAGDRRRETGDSEDAEAACGVAPDADATRAGAVMGTPAYMAPEQARGDVDATDARSDVFALGCILFEVLTGGRVYGDGPADVILFRAASAMLEDALTRLAECGAEADLVGLCRRCLDADQANRPVDGGSVAAAVAELRAAADERARRAEVERERAAVAAAAERKGRRVVLGWAVAVAVVLAAGAGVSVWQAVRAANAEGRARTDRDAAVTAQGKAETEERNAKEAAELARRRREEAVASEADTRAFSDFLVYKVLAASRPAGVQLGIGKDVKLSEALRAAEQSFDDVFAGRPKAEATARHALGVTWRNLAEYDRAERHLKRAVELRVRELGPDAEDTLDSLNSLGVLFDVLGRREEAVSLLKRALAGREKALGPDHPQTLVSASNLAELYRAQGRYEECELLYKRALAGMEKAHGPDHPHTLTVVNNLAAAYLTWGRYEQAAPLLKRTQGIREATLGPDHADALVGLNNLAELYRSRGQYEEAVAVLMRALAGSERIYGPDLPDTLTVVNNLAAAYLTWGRYEEAEPLYKRVLAGLEKAQGPDHPDTITAALSLAFLYFNTDRYNAAVPLFRRALHGYEKRPDGALGALVARLFLGLSLLRDGKPAEAEPHLLAGYDGLKPLEKRLGSSGLNRLRWVTAGLVEVYERTNQPEKAKEWRAKLAALPPEVAPPPRPVR